MSGRPRFIKPAPTISFVAPVTPKNLIFPPNRAAEPTQFRSWPSVPRAFVSSSDGASSNLLLNNGNSDMPRSSVPRKGDFFPRILAQDSSRVPFVESNPLHFGADSTSQHFAQGARFSAPVRFPRESRMNDPSLDVDQSFQNIPPNPPFSLTPGQSGPFLHPSQQPFPPVLPQPQRLPLPATPQLQPQPPRPYYSTSPANFTYSKPVVTNQPAFHADQQTRSLAYEPASGAPPDFDVNALVVPPSTVDNRSSDPSQFQYRFSCQSQEPQPVPPPAARWPPPPQLRTPVSMPSARPYLETRIQPPMQMFARSPTGAFKRSNPQEELEQPVAQSGFSDPPRQWPTSREALPAPDPKRLRYAPAPAGTDTRAFAYDHPTSFEYSSDPSLFEFERDRYDVGAHFPPAPAVGALSSPERVPQVDFGPAVYPPPMPMPMPMQNPMPMPMPVPMPPTAAQCEAADNEPDDLGRSQYPDSFPVPQNLSLFVRDLGIQTEASRARPLAPIQEFCIKHEITMYSDEGIIKPIFTFEEASVPETLVNLLPKILGSNIPPPIMAQSWPVLFAGRDLALVVSPKNCRPEHKILSYLVPVLLHVLKQEHFVWGECPPSSPGPLALVVASDVRQATELASQLRRLQECAEFGSLCCAVSHRSSSTGFVAPSFLFTVNSRPVPHDFNMQRAHLLILDVDRLLMLLRLWPPDFFDRVSMVVFDSLDMLIRRDASEFAPAGYLRGDGMPYANLLELLRLELMPLIRGDRQLCLCSSRLGPDLEQETASLLACRSTRRAVKDDRDPDSVLLLVGNRDELVDAPQLNPQPPNPALSPPFRDQPSVSRSSVPASPSRTMNSSISGARDRRPPPASASAYVAPNESHRPPILPPPGEARPRGQRFTPVPLAELDPYY